jgi:FixJ family two-component response regulator
LSAPLIHVIDDDESIRTSVARLLSIEGYEVRTHDSAGSYLLAPPEPNAGCIVLDLTMPGPSGLDLQESLRRFPLSLPIVFLTGTADVPATVRAMKAGAVDFLTKPVMADALLSAIEAALARHRSDVERRESVEEARLRHGTLSPRERSVFDHVVAGKPNKVIGRALGITERTVKMHRAQVMAKMHARSLAELVQLAALLEREGT